MRYIANGSHIDCEEFVRLYAGRISAYCTSEDRVEDASKGDLNDVMRAVTAIANDPNGQCSIKSVAYEKGENYTRAGIIFDTRQARRAVEEIERHKREIEKKSDADVENVLMRFYQPNLKDAERSGEKVIIENIADLPFPIVYASELARQRIKSEIMHGDKNIFKLGFFVDANIEFVRGRVAAYRLLNVREVIELPPDIGD